MVDDDPTVSNVVSAYLTKAGYAARVVADGVSAVEVWQQWKPSVVVLDVMLPGLSGLEVLRRMRAAGHTTDVIMVTQARDLAVVRAAIAFGATQYLVKPFTSGAVRAKLEGYLTYRDRLAGGRPIAQNDVDGLFDALRAPVGADALPKTVSRETLDAVVATLRPGAGITAQEVGEALGMSRVTARRYLEHLVDAGLAVREPRYGGTGRPQLEYRVPPPR